MLPHDWDQDLVNVAVMHRLLLRSYCRSQYVNLSIGVKVAIVCCPLLLQGLLPVLDQHTVWHHFAHLLDAKQAEVIEALEKSAHGRRGGSSRRGRQLQLSGEDRKHVALADIRLQIVPAEVLTAVVGAMEEGDEEGMTGGR